MDNLGAISSKYKNIGGYSKEDTNLTSPHDEKNHFQKFEKKYLQPIFSKPESEDLNLTYSIQDKKDVESVRRMEFV